MNIKPAKIMVGLLVLALALGLMTWLVAKANKSGPAGVRHEMTNLAAGLACYQSVFGSFPTGENTQVADALRGGNPRKMMIDPIGPRRMNKGKELLDIWDTPYRFVFVSNSQVTVSSAGMNGLFGDDDDLIVRASLNDTNFPFWKGPFQLTNTPPQK